MPRPNRDFVPGFPAHVVHRGNDRRDIFKCTGDYLFFRKCLDEAARTEGVEVHSYVLMTNHFHLLLTPKDALGISKLMHSAMRRYAG
jgi:putative transposase